MRRLRLRTAARPLGCALPLLFLAIAVVRPLSAQTTTGNLYVRVVDEQGGVMPGVIATLSGCGAPQTATTGSQGELHFLNLAPCAYALRTELDGFTTVERGNVVVDLGSNTEFSIAMKVAPVSTAITVSSESPLLDTRKQISGTTFTQQELESIPTARNPWVMLQQTPGVLVTRQDVGGSEAGTQNYFVGKGTDITQNAWNIDGVSITDMVSAGFSTTYYDFDAFEQIEMTTGGSDPTVAVPGVTINMVTKRATNDVHGSARIFETPGELQARPVTVFNGARSIVVDRIDDYGTEAGGPLWPDRAWLWGSYGMQQINKTNAGVSDKTTLENFAGKFNLQAIESNNFTLFYFRGDKRVFGRLAGPTHPQETTWDQKGPTTIWKGDDSQVFGPSLVASANWSWTDFAFTVTPEGGAGPSGPDVYVDPQGIWRNSYLYSLSKRPQHQVNANLSAFFSTGAIGHELKFGFGYRKYDVASLTAWPGQGNIGYENFGIAKLARERFINYEARYYDAFLSDTLMANNLTVNVGVRWDDQASRNLPSAAPANAAFPELLPAVSYAGSGYLVDLKDWQPRVGLTYALGAKKTTLLRASYARFADQIGTWAAFENPIGYQYLYYYWTDNNGNHRPDPGELGAFYYASNVDPNNPGLQTPLNRIDPNLKNTTTDELMAGIDHKILPEFVAGLTYTYRHRKNFVWTPYTQLTSANYSLFAAGFPAYDQNGNPIGTSDPLYACTLNGIACGDPTSGFTFGKTMENRPGFSTTYQSVELALTKRLSHHWMAHGSLTWTDWKQHIDDKATGCQDPTNTTDVNGGSCGDGIAYWGFGGNNGGVFLNAQWAFNVSALYQLPLNFNLAANFYGRQGYPLPYYVQKSPGDGLGKRTILVGSPDDHRNQSLFQLDLRAEKVIPLFQKADLTLSVDVFNALNRHTVLQQRTNATAGSAGLGGNASQVGQVAEVQNPRILRFGARLGF